MAVTERVVRGIRRSCSNRQSRRSTAAIPAGSRLLTVCHMRLTVSASVSIPSLMARSSVRACIERVI